jgi:hypothetical protein
MFTALACGFLAQPGKRTVCGMLSWAALSRLWPHDRAHWFFSRAAPSDCRPEPTLSSAVMAARSRRARIDDVHELALGMPHVTVWKGPQGNPIYQVGGKSFVFFRTPRPDAVDPDTGERYPDVIMFWVTSEDDKLALIQDQASPFFTTPHFDGHPSVLIRGSRVGELTVTELSEIIQDAWLARASSSRAAAWFKSRG